MTHVRTQIRRRLRTDTLASVASSTGSGEISQSRSRPVSRYPSVAVSGDREQRITVENPAYINGGTKRYRRFYYFTIEAAVQTSVDPDEALDELCAKIETAVANDDTMGGGVIATDLVEVRFERRGEGEEETHIALMTYVCEFRTDADDPQAFLS